MSNFGILPLVDLLKMGKFGGILVVSFAENIFCSDKLSDC